MWVSLRAHTSDLIVSFSHSAHWLTCEGVQESGTWINGMGLA